MHTSEVPIRQISDPLSVEVIQKTSCLPCFTELSAALENLEAYRHLYLQNFAQVKLNTAITSPED